MSEHFRCYYDARGRSEVLPEDTIVVVVKSEFEGRCGIHHVTANGVHHSLHRPRVYPALSTDSPKTKKMRITVRRKRCSLSSCFIKWDELEPNKTPLNLPWGGSTTNVRPLKLTSSKPRPLHHTWITGKRVSFRWR